MAKIKYSKDFETITHAQATDGTLNRFIEQEIDIFNDAQIKTEIANGVLYGADINAKVIVYNINIVNVNDELTYTCDALMYGWDGEKKKRAYYEIFFNLCDYIHGATMTRKDFYICEFVENYN